MSRRDFTMYWFFMGWFFLKKKKKRGESYDVITTTQTNFPDSAATVVHQLRADRQAADVPSQWSNYRKPRRSCFRHILAHSSPGWLFLHFRKESLFYFNVLTCVFTLIVARSGTYPSFFFFFLTKIEWLPPGYNKYFFVMFSSFVVWLCDSPANCLSRAADQDGWPALWITPDYAPTYKRRRWGRKSKEK